MGKTNDDDISTDLLEFIRTQSCYRAFYLLGKVFIYI